MPNILRNAVRRVLSNHSVALRVCQPCRRHISIHNLDPSIRDFTSLLVRKQPAFSVSAKNIRILSEPPKFYGLFLEMVRRAQTRIFISSLYIGSAEKELITTLEKALSEKPKLQLHLHLDLNRSTRPGASSTAKILLPLLRKFPSQVHISLFRSPSLRGVLAKLVPPRFNEGWGTWHAKIYGADDEVMISGANLNKSYFTNRQDRYIHFAAQPHLAQYCFDFLQTVSTFSYKLLPSTSSPSAINDTHSYNQEDYTLHWPDSQTHPHHIHKKASTAFQQLQDSYRQSEPFQLATTEPAPDSSRVILSPIIQAGQFGIREEESTLQLLFRKLDLASLSARDSAGSSLQAAKSTRRPLLDLTSGYFGLYEPYQDLILTSTNVDCRIIAASPKANGFYGSKGISGRIPEGYTLLEKRFMKAVEKASRLWLSPNTANPPIAEGVGSGTGTGVQLNEWEKDGWTYHAKGIWLSPSQTSAPVLTLFGSTNLNSRSAHLDTELSFFMIIPSTPGESTKPVQPLLADERHSGDGGNAAPSTSSTLALRHQLAAEIEQLRVHAIPWRGAQRKVRFWTKVIVKLVKGML